LPDPISVLAVRAVEDASILNTSGFQSVIKPKRPQTNLFLNLLTLNKPLRNRIILQQPEHLKNLSYWMCQHVWRQPV